MVEDSVAVSNVHDARLEAHDSAGWNLELKVRLSLTGIHDGHGTTNVTKDLNDLAGILWVALNNSLLNRLKRVALSVLLEQNARTTNLEFKALAAHALHKNGEVQNTTTRNLNTRLIRKLLDAHGDVILALCHQALFKLTATNNVSLTANKWRGRRLKNNGKGWWINLNWIQLNRVLWISVDVTNISVINANDCRNITCVNLAALLTAKVVKGEQLLDLAHGAGTVVFNNKNLVASMNCSGIDTANTNAAQVVGVIDGDTLHSKRSVNINIWSWKTVDNHVEKREHIVVVIIWIKASVTVNARSKDDVLHGELKLLISCAEVHHQIKRIVDNSLWASAVTVNLVDNHHDRKACVDSVAQNKASLWHRAFSCVNQKQCTVGHLQNTLYLAAEVSVARGINNVDLDALVLNRDILCQNSNSALTLLIVGVQNSLLNLLVLAECIGCLKHLVNHGGFTVVNVSDDSNISDVVLTHKSLSLEGMCLDLLLQVQFLSALEL